MYKIGLFPGKFLPPHRGHLHSIIQASTQCEKLYVVVSDNKQVTEKYCANSGIKNMPMLLRAKWLSQELSGFDHIQVICLDESSIPSYPNGIKEWVELLHKTVPEKFSIIFGGEEEYRHTIMPYMSDVEYIVYDSDRAIFDVSATRIRNNFLDNWDYILGSARGHFAKRVLITGTESAGKTTLTKYLAKIFYTSWSEEYGRYYSRDHLGGNESIFTEEDFVRIAQIQKQYDEEALRTANKICFFDTDAVVTKYYGQVYLNKTIDEIDDYINLDNYDAVLFMSPDVKWVNDGLRFSGEQSLREKLNKVLYDMYVQKGFESKLYYVRGSSYSDRLNTCITICNTLLKGE